MRREGGGESAWEASLYSFKQHQMSSNDHFGGSTKNLKSLCEHNQKGALGKCTNFVIRLQGNTMISNFSGGLAWT